MPITNLSTASPNHILASLSRMRPGYNSQNAWVSNSNKYVIDTITKLKADFAGGTIDSVDIIDYIASSVYIHAFNSWSYLSSAINSYLEGDYANAVHNAYYAELRAIMSILASRGVGVFNGNNVIVDNAGSIHQATCTAGEHRTHLFAKTAFDQLLNDSANTNEILSLLQIEGHSLKNWFDATSFAPGSTMPTMVARNWLQEWSMDMSIIVNDQDFRNFVSYRPQNFSLSYTKNSDNIHYRLNFLIELWKICSPGNYFSLSILRNSFETLYRTIFGYANLAALDVERDIKPILTDLGSDPNDAVSQYIIRFLRRDIESTTNQVFTLANFNFSNPILESDVEPVGIISRATLLALMNTKILESLLRQSGTSKTDLKFWYDHIGLRLGYWEAASEPYIYSDLWADIEMELDLIKNWMAGAGPHTPYTFKNNIRNRTSNIIQLNKTYLWGTAI